MPLGAAPRATARSTSSSRSIAERVDDVLVMFLADRRAELEPLDPVGVLPLDEVIRLVRAGGKRLRPIFCYWGYRSAGAEDGDPIMRAAAALELLHTMALIHDDLMDGAATRRGVPASGLFLAGEAVRLDLPGEPEQTGRSLAILAGDLAAVLADRLLLDSGFDADALVRALGRYHEMRIQMALGQALDLGPAPTDPAAAGRVAAMKGGAYTVDGPLLIGAALASASLEVERSLAAYGRPLGEAFQLADDLRDDDAPTGISGDRVRSLAAQATAALDPTVLESGSVEILRSLANMVATS